MNSAGARDGLEGDGLDDMISGDKEGVLGE